MNTQIFDIINQSELKKKKEYKNKKLHIIEYYNVATAFDIEDSSWEDNGEKYATMYLWAFAVNDIVIQGRTWEEFKSLIEKIKDKCMLSINRRIIVYVHNLSHEFAFMCRWFEWDTVFAASERRPIYALTKDGVEFRCSYILTGLSLYNLSKTLNNDDLIKKIGDLDYRLIRHSKTPLSDKELEYSRVDVLILTEYINKCIKEENGDISKIPLTKTAYARRLCRQSTLYSDRTQHKKYRQLMKQLTIEVDEYAQMKRAFMGGFTHCSCLKAGKTYKDVTSFDFASSYPAVMVSEMFPMSKGKIIKVKSIKEFELLCKKYCVIFDVKLKNVKSKIWYDHYLSISKCVTKGKVTTDNGRLVECVGGEIIKNGNVEKYECGEVLTTLTNIDWQIIKICYEWDNIEVGNVRVYQKNYLPTDFIKPVLTLYQNKTELKNIDGEEDFYLRCKEILNSTYGMSVSNIVRDIISFVDGLWRVEENADVTGEIDKYNNSKNRFLFYGWGLYITAYARYNLWTGISHIKYDYIYSDTDSIKILNAYKYQKYFADYNNNIYQKLLKACDYHGLSYDLIEPKTKEGVKKILGVWELDGVYSRFKSLGAKRYLVEYTKDNSLHTTVAGLGKKAGVTYLKKLCCTPKQIERYNNIADEEAKEEYLNKCVEKKHDKIFELFDDELYFPKGETGKLIMTYIDYETKGKVTDYTGKTAYFHELTSVHMDECDFSLNLSVEFMKFLAGLVNHEDEI